MTAKWTWTAILLLAACLAGCKTKTAFEVYGLMRKDMIPSVDGWVPQAFSNTAGPGSIFVKDAHGRYVTAGTFTQLKQAPLGGAYFELRKKHYSATDADALREALKLDDMRQPNLAQLVPATNEPMITRTMNSNAEAGLDIGYTPQGQTNIVADLDLAIKQSTDVTVSCAQYAVVSLTIAPWGGYLSCIADADPLRRAMKGNSAALCTKALAVRGLSITYALKQKLDPELKLRLQRGVAPDKSGFHAGFKVEIKDDQSLKLSTPENQWVYLDCYFDDIGDYVDREFGTWDGSTYIAGSGREWKDKFYHLFGLVLTGETSDPIPDIMFRPIHGAIRTRLGINREAADSFNRHRGFACDCLWAALQQNTRGDLGLGARVKPSTVDWQAVARSAVEELQRLGGESDIHEFDLELLRGLIPELIENWKTTTYRITRARAAALER